MAMAAAAIAGTTFRPSGERGRSGSASLRVRLAHGALGILGRRAPREDEPQIGRPFRQRRQHLIGLRRDPNVRDIRDPQRLVHTRDAAIDAFPRNRHHHHGGSLRATGCQLADVLANRMAQQKLLERQTVPAPVDDLHGPRAQAADWPRRDFEHGDA